MKEKGGNAPVSRKAAAAYTSALDHLLRVDSPNRLSLADATTVFWEEKAEPATTSKRILPWFFADPPRDDPDERPGGRGLVRGGAYRAPAGRRRIRFHVLGLSPNAARLAVRFWKVGTVKEFADHIIGHFEISASSAPLPRWST